MYKKLATITMILILTSSCTPMPKSWDWGLQGRPMRGVKGFPEADTDYGRGFKDGCSMALSTISKGHTESISRTINPQMIGNSTDFSSGWWDGYEQCTYIYDWDVI